MNTNNTAEVAHTTEQPEEGGALSSLGINGTLLGFQLFNFALVALVLWFLILKPLTKKMTERQKMIDDSIENAKRVEENLIKSEQKYQERIDQAKVEANKIMGNAVTEAEQAGALLKDKAKKEIELLAEQAKKNIVHERDEMVLSLKKETADLIVVALEKLLNEKMDASKDKKVIEELLKKI